MQATESARAKALENSSPISSPDVQEKDIHVKKRHSLPGANGRQGSPRNQRSKSRSRQGSKGNGHPYGLCIDWEKEMQHPSISETVQEMPVHLSSLLVVCFDG
ncbi:Protein IQ-DOMAIN 32, partial [Sarracenia purpurea var. burkii]